MIRIDKHPRLTRKMSTVRRPLRVAASVAAMLAAATIGGHAALADIVVVQQDNTPIASAPGVGGRIVARVDAGTTLTVLGREGEWLQVEGLHLHAAGMLWIPAARVSDVIAAPAEMATAQPAAATEVPQFRMMTGSTERTMTPALGADGGANARNSGGVSTSATRSTETNARTGTAAVQSSGTTAAAGGASTTAVGNTASAATTDGTTVDNNPTAAQGNPTTAVSSNPTPALGNPTPAATGNATPALGNPTPAMGNSVSGFGRTATRTP